MSVDISDLMKQGAGLIEKLTDDVTDANVAEAGPNAPVSGAPASPIVVEPVSGEPLLPVHGLPIVKAPLTDLVYDEGARVVANVRHTKYQHNECIDEATGTYDTDCSGFVSYVLSRVAKKHLALIPKESWWPVPRAYMYYRFFAAAATEGAHGWQRIERLEDARRGDIIAWELPGEIRKDHDTGHVWIVAETPEPVGAGLMAVKGFDSAELHHYDDSRKGGETGVGSGTFHLRVDAQGAPTAFQFGPGDNFHTDPIAIGRIIPG